jgi:hypothetical protein
MHLPNTEPVIHKSLLKLPKTAAAFRKTSLELPRTELFSTDIASMFADIETMSVIKIQITYFISEFAANSSLTGRRCSVLAIREIPSCRVSCDMYSGGDPLGVLIALCYSDAVPGAYAMAILTTDYLAPYKPDR